MEAILKDGVKINQPLKKGTYEYELRISKKTGKLTFGTGGKVFHGAKKGFMANLYAAIRF
jgi:hypothetical protein